MDQRQFLNTIQQAVNELDRDALSCMARALLMVAEQCGNNYAFTSSKGTVKVEAFNNIDPTITPEIKGTVAKTS